MRQVKGPRSGWKSMVEVLRNRADTEGGETAFVFADTGEAITYGELDRRARAIASTLQARLQGGRPVLLLYPPGVDYIAGFFGCLYAGVIAVPAYPPLKERQAQRLRSIVEDCGATLALTNGVVLGNPRALKGLEAPEEPRARLEWLSTGDLSAEAADEWSPVDLSGRELAFLQYTSGSTAAPKGVMVAHSNLLANLRDIRRFFALSPEWSCVSWLPPYHDMGLIGCILEPVYCGLHTYLMAPTTFLQHPMKWLRLISAVPEGPVTSGGPNFAFDLCSQKVDEEDLAALDLSRWRLAWNGAERVRGATLDRFAQTFWSAGFARRAFYPCYGMAECTLIATGGDLEADPVTGVFSAEELERRAAVPVEPESPDARVLVSSGRVAPGQGLRVVDTETGCVCADRQVGEIWLAGESVTQGYWRRAELTEAAFQARTADTGEGPFLRTGDLGFLDQGELFVMGRLKDMLILRGRNHYPEDLELTVGQAHPDLVPGGGAAVAVEAEDGEALVIVQEARRRGDGDPEAEIFASIRQALAEQHGVEVHAILLLRAGTIPKTSSGKIQRHQCRLRYLEGELREIARWERGAEPAVDEGAQDHRVDTIPAPAQVPAVPKTRREIEAWLVEWVAERVGVRASEMDPVEAFARYGLGSADAIRLTGELEKLLGRELSPTAAYHYPTFVALSSFLAGAPAEPASLGGDDFEAGSPSSEPIAIVGLSCRFPGSPTPEAFWDLLREGRSGIGPVPPGRWPARALPSEGALPSRGGFLDRVDGFDAELFGISPKEARVMDPQQRLLLEVAWEALERAGLGPGQLAGSKTGVFVGISTADYARIVDQSPQATDAYLGTGTAFSIAANRLSYVLDLRGPSLAVDTACSSSLVAVHLAVRSLRAGECERAIVGGVNLLLRSELSEAFSRAQMLAPGGLCRTFDAGAEGYVRGEGCGVVVLAPLSRALADGHSVLALVRGSAVNQDGRSNGLTAPNGLAQEQVIRAALADAGVAPREVSYVEAHGTGTPLGDPIEIEGLKAVLVPGREVDRPCAVASVKTNLGHLEAAAGIAGLIKTVLALEAGALPPHLNLTQINPRIQLDGVPIVIPRQLVPWSSDGTPRRAGVSSFGFGGANAHVILEEAPALPLRIPGRRRATELLTLSAKSRPALVELAGRWRSALASASGDLASVCATANGGRATWNHRMAVLGADAKEMGEALGRFLVGPGGAGPGGAGFWAGEVGRVPRIAFLWTGQGAQYVGMGADLFETEPVFRSTLLECEEALRGELEQPLLAVLYPEAGTVSPIDQTVYAQPALFALELGLWRLWRSWGIEPVAVLGHSVGQYAAACAAGVLSPEEGLRLTALRGRLMQALPREGRMVAVFAPVDEVVELLAPVSDAVAVAAVNGPAHTVISGHATAVTRVVDELVAAGFGFEALNVSHAFHSPLLDPILPELEEALRRIDWQPPQLTVISNATGAVATAEELTDPVAWRRQAREPVLFQAGLESLAALGCDTLVELGPSPVLLAMARRALGGGDSALLLPSLRKGHADGRQILGSLAALHTRGATVDWRSFQAATGARRLPLPTYPFQRQRFWVEPLGEGEGAAGQARKPASSWVGERLRLAAATELRFETRLGLARTPELRDHRVCGAAVVPAALWVELAVSAARHHFGAGTAVKIDGMSFPVPLELGEVEEHLVQTVVGIEGALARMQIHASPAEAQDAPWAVHAEGRLSACPPSESGSGDLDALRGRLEPGPGVEGLYQRLAGIGLLYGPAFRGIAEIWLGKSEALGRLELPGAVGELTGVLNPCLLDAAFQLLASALPVGFEDGLYLPVGIQRISHFRSLGREAWGHARIAPVKPGAAQLSGDLDLFDGSGGLVAEVRGLVLRRVSSSSLVLRRRNEVAGWLYQLDWLGDATSASETSAASEAAPLEGTWLVLSGADPLGDQLATELTSRGARVVQARVGGAKRWTGAASLEIDPTSAHDFEGLVQEVLQQGPQLGGVVFLWGLELRAADGSGELQPALETVTLGALHLARALSAAGLGGLALWWVTRCAQDGGIASGFGQAALWGLARSWALEQQAIRSLAIDIDESTSAAQLLAELERGTSEPQLVLRGDKRLYPRLVHVAGEAARLVLPEAGDWRLAGSPRGLLEDLRAERVDLPSPGAGEVLIEVEAAGLNFRDVLTAMGLYPGEAGPLGSECAGRVLAVGTGVEDVAVGEPVVAIAAGTFGSTVLADANLLARRPSDLSAEAGATLPIPFLTASWALEAIAGLRRGERVLIHAAAGGVGLAAVQIAQRLGAEVFATASPGKWAELERRGVAHVFNSRTLDFAEQVLARTGGRGVDVVLNSLSDEFIPRSLAVLAPAGRFIEIGKRGIWDAERVARMRPDVGYHVFDLDQVCRDEPAQAGWALRGLVAAIERGELQPLPLRAFELTEAVEAFRTLAAARHIGKIVLTRPRRSAPELRFAPDATYVVSGGLGGVGLALASWLVEHGAGQLLILSRNAPSETAATRLAALELRGCRVLCRQVDVADEAALGPILAEARALLPLRGVFHAAGVLDDGPLATLDAERFSRVLRPKLLGGWALHRGTRHDSLDHFVLISSIAGTLGSPAQTSYAAANAGLDALAAARRSLGLPASSVAFGPWEQTGMTARLEARQNERIGARGLRALPPARALDALGRALATGQAHVVVADADWNALAPSLQLGGSSRLLAALVEAADPRTGQSFRRQLEEAPTRRRRALLQAHVAATAARVLGLASAEALDPRQALQELGADSLMALELRSALGASLDLETELPATLLFKYPSVEALTTYLATEVLALDAKPKVAEPASVPTRPELDPDASEEELAALLSQELTAGARRMSP